MSHDGCLRSAGSSVFFFIAHLSWYLTSYYLQGIILRILGIFWCKFNFFRVGQTCVHESGKALLKLLLAFMRRHRLDSSFPCTWTKLGQSLSMHSSTVSSFSRAFTGANPLPSNILMPVGAIQLLALSKVDWTSGLPRILGGCY